MYLYHFYKNKGPGAYRPTSSINKEGKYNVSRFRSSKVRSFGKQKRHTTEIRNEDIPGPGQYTLPSDFGYY